MFRKIGQFEISADGDLIVVRSEPQFNLEAAREYAVAMSDVIARMARPFGVLASFDAPPIMGPEVEVAMRDTAALRARSGMAAVAFVIGDQHGLSIAHGQWNRIYTPLAVPFAVFGDAGSARAWLRAQLDKHAATLSAVSG